MFQTKAGLENCDASRIAKIIKSASKNSEYYKTEERRMQVVKEKVSKYKAKIEKHKSNAENWALREFDVKRKIVAHSREIDVTRTWVHVDMDMFYAAIEIRDTPELEDKAVAVGDCQMIQTTNYVARKFGVKSGLPGFIGKNLIWRSINKFRWKSKSCSSYGTRTSSVPALTNSCSMSPST